MERIEFNGVQFNEISVDWFGNVDIWFREYLKIMKDLSIPWVGVLKRNSIGFVSTFLFPEDCDKSVQELFISKIFEYTNSSDLAYNHYCRILCNDEDFINVYTDYVTNIDGIEYLLKDDKIYKQGSFMETTYFRGIHFEEIPKDAFRDVYDWWEHYLLFMEELKIEWIGIQSTTSIGVARAFCVPDSCTEKAREQFVQKLLTFIYSSDIAYEQLKQLKDYEDCLYVYPREKDFIENITILLKDGKFYRRV